METILLTILILAEIVYAVFALSQHINKKQWVTGRVMMNSSELLLYLLSVLLPHIDFSFRFTVLLVILILRALISGIIYLAKKSGYHKNPNSSRKKVAFIVLSIIGSVILISLSMLPAFLFSDYQGLPSSGPYKVAKTEAILIDESRVETFEKDGSKREIPVHFYYPEDADGSETYPLVIFSHGAFGFYQSNDSTYCELASNGYIVISLDHPYHSFFTEDTNGNLITVSPTFMSEVMYVNQSAVEERDVQIYFKKWLTIRDADMNCVIDSFVALDANQDLPANWYQADADKKTIPSIRNITNCDKIGLMGHSLGGAASVNVGKNRDDISAVIDLDGTMGGEILGFTEEEYEFNGKIYPEAIYDDTPYPVPLLAIDNEEHHLTREDTGILYVNNVVLNNAIDGHSTYFIGAGHMNFTDLPLFSPILASKLGTGTIDEKECITQTNAIVLSFMNHYLKNEGEFNIQESYE